MKALLFFRRNWLETAINAVSIALVTNCIFPINIWLAKQAIPILLGCLAIGGLAFLLKRKSVMLINFLGCIALCNFLKDAQNSRLNYAPLIQDVAVRVAHFSPQDAEAKEQLLSEIKKFSANLISIQTTEDSNYTTALKSKLSNTHRYFKKLSYPNNISTILFSTYPIQDLDTLFSDDAPSLAGSIWIDSTHGKIRFFSTHISGLLGNASSKTAQEKLHEISRYLEQSHSKSPLLTWGNIQLTAWSPEVRQFKNDNNLNDSRIDIAWEPCDEHIFYSNHLQCVSFSTILNGIGVLGVYQFNEQTDKTDKLHTLNDTARDLTMF